MPPIEVFDPLTGIPRRRIPLRLAPLIVHQRPETVLGWLVDARDDGPPGQAPYYRLTGYEFCATGSHGLGTSQVYRAILADVTNVPSLEGKIEKIPPGHFVNSDELAAEFRHFATAHFENEEFVPGGILMVWTPALTQRLGELLNECPPFNGGASGSAQGQTRNSRTDMRRARIKRLVEEKRAVNPRLSLSAACKLVETDLKNSNSDDLRDAKTIRRMFYKPSPPKNS